MSSEPEGLVARYVIEVKKRVRSFPAPADDFDPLKASDDERAAFGLPPRPDPQGQPLAYAFWHRLLSAPLKILSAGDPLTKRPDYRLNYRALGRGGRLESSRNWSGAK